MGFGFDPEEPRRELTADFTLELLEVPPLDDDLDPRAEDTADLILEAVLLTLLEVELLRLELELLLELLHLDGLGSLLQSLRRGTLDRGLCARDHAQEAEVTDR